MLENIEISNFKSIKNIKLELGRVNIFIGENGSGKSNILEAVAFLGSYIANKSDDEYLSNRGIRFTEPNNLKSFIKNFKSKHSIIFSFKFGEILFDNVELNHVEGKWSSDKMQQIINNNSLSNSLINFNNEFLPTEINKINELKERLNSNKSLPEIDKVNLESIIDKMYKALIDTSKLADKKTGLPLLENFLIFSLENTNLRSFSDEGQILPLGIKGEGLFKEVKRLFEKNNKTQINQILKELKILDWFESFEIPKYSFPGEKAFQIKDKYLAGAANYFDQRLANEGFLYLLFYFTLLISEKTPSFFAIDNIDASLNPKLCSELIKRMTNISKTKKKQFIATTHNPFILDGLNIEDDTQRLFVVSRNINGETIVNRIKPKEKLSIPLSEAWMRGYLGGLPNNF